MYIDMFGKPRMKVNLHLHTTDSDGRKSPEDAAAQYKAAGYDMIAITDHWDYKLSSEVAGLRTIGGAEFNTPESDGARGVYHIVGLGCKCDPGVEITDPVQVIIDKINESGGLAVLGHPYWSLNTYVQAQALTGIGATEIYNSISDVHESARGYSGDFVDTAACYGLIYPLLATDDTHYYDGTDDCLSYSMLECSADATDDEILDAIRQQKFYSTQGPELHLRVENGQAIVDCSPVSRICLLSNNVWCEGHSINGENLTHHTYTLAGNETYIRAEVTDANGRKGWSNVIKL